MSAREAYTTTFWARCLALALCLAGLVPTGFAQTLSQTEFQKLTNPSDVTMFDSFGKSIALSGNRALVGRDDSDDRPRPAYVYERDATGTWVEVAQLMAPNSDQLNEDGNGIGFGNSVALSGDLALVGANRSGDAGFASGSAYLFERDSTGAWVEVTKLTASDALAGGNFGISVALLGGRALIGAVKGDDGFAPAYVFERDGAGRWVEVARFTDPDAVDGDGFNFSGVLSGDRLLVSGWTDEAGDGDILLSGSLYERDVTGAWVQVATLNPSDVAASRQVQSFALSGDRALIGAPGNVDSGINSGSAYVFERSSEGTWDEVAKLNAPDGAPSDRFGYSVALSGDLALIGARLDDDKGRSSGSVYVYQRTEAGAWVLLNKLNASDGMRNDEFGSSVAFSDGRALVAAPDTERFTGSVYVFNILDVGDLDQDGIVDTQDNCPTDLNPLQENFDGDLLGDVCDPDDDNDGIDDTSDAYPLDPTRPGAGGLPPLILDSVDTNRYGFRFEGIDNYRESLELNFDASGSDLFLSLTGYDIDTRQEVRVLVNGAVVGFMSRTPNNGRGRSELTIARSLLSSTGNTLRIEQLNPGWKWGVTDLLLSEIGGSAGLPTLFLDSVDSGRYGFRFEDVDNNRVSLDRLFYTSGSDLTLTLTGYDIDNRQEVRVLVNGTEIGFLSRTPNRGSGPSQLRIDRNLLRSSAGNTLRFEQLNPGWMWGVTNLLLSESGS